jgi:hypothetical protein
LTGFDIIFNSGSPVGVVQILAKSKDLGWIKPESETKPRWSCSGKKKKNWTNPLVVSRRLVAEPPQQEDERACSVAGSLLRL